MRLSNFLFLQTRSYFWSYILISRCCFVLNVIWPFVRLLKCPYCGTEKPEIPPISLSLSGLHTSLWDSTERMQHLQRCHIFNEILNQGPISAQKDDNKSPMAWREGEHRISPWRLAQYLFLTPQWNKPPAYCLLLFGKTLPCTHWLLHFVHLCFGCC